MAARQQAYKGPANWEWIKQCKEAATTIKVIGNGDLFDAEAVKKMFDHTQCDAVLISRGTLGQPWIAEDTIRLLGGMEPVARTTEDCRQMLLEHFLETVQYHHPRRVVVDMRRVGCWYLKKSSGTRAFRELISKADSLHHVEDLIRHFPIGKMEEEMYGENEPNEAE